MDIKTFKEEIKKINAGDGVHIKVLSKDYQPAIENNKLRPEWWANQNWAEFSYENKKLFLSSVGEVDVLITDKASGDMLEHHKAPINDSSIITEDDDIMLILDGDTDYALAFDETPMLALVNAKGKPVHYFNYNNNVVTALLDHLDEIKDIMSPKEEVKAEPKSEEKPKAKDEPKEKKEEEPKAEKTKNPLSYSSNESSINKIVHFTKNSVVILCKFFWYSLPLRTERLIVHMSHEIITKVKNNFISIAITVFFYDFVTSIKLVKIVF